MKRFVKLIAPILSILFASCQSVPKANSISPVRVWIDTDPSVGEPDRDVDDGLAMLFAFRSPQLSIRGISTVFGNTDQAHAYPIAQRLTQSLSGDQKIKVFRGAEKAGEFKRETSASLALSEALGREDLTLLVLGPATNIATVLSLHPELASKIKAIIAVAGRRPGQRFTTGTSNLKAHRDFNFEQDPEAFRVLLSSKVPLVLTPFEISSRFWIEEPDLKLLSHGNETKQWLAKSAMNWLHLWQSTFGVNGFNPFDALAVGFLTDLSLYHCEDVKLEIQVLPDDGTEERMQGTNAMRKPYLIATDALEDGSRSTFCGRADPEFKSKLMEKLIK